MSNTQKASSIKTSSSEPNVMFTLLRTVRTLGLACLLASAAMGPAWAGEGANGTRVIPFDGVLDFQGSGFSGELDMEFLLYDAASDGVQLWQETWDGDVATSTSVTFVDGRFSVNLGTHTSIEPIIASRSDLYLAVGFRAADSVGDFTRLTGRQRLNPVPFALWSGSAHDLTLSGGVVAAGGFSSTDGGFTVIGGAMRTETGNFETIDGDIETFSGHIRALSGTVQGQAGSFESLTVDGVVEMPQCRICRNYVMNGIFLATVCVRLIDGASSGFDLSAGALEDRFEPFNVSEGLVFVCDNGPSGWQNAPVLQEEREGDNVVR